jgi:hypothetical protein
LGGLYFDRETIEKMNDGFHEVDIDVYAGGKPIMEDAG